MKGVSAIVGNTLNPGSESRGGVETAHRCVRMAPSRVMGVA